MNVRKTEEDKLLQEFSAKQQELRQECERLTNIQQEKKSLIDDLKNVQGKTVAVTEILMNSEGIKRCTKIEAFQKEQVKEAAKRVEEKKSDLFAAMKKRKMLENLKSKQYATHQSQANLLERTAIDEMAITRFNRREQK